MTKVLSLRVPDDLAAWADEYSKLRGVTRQALLEEGLRSFREDCEKGVPEIRERERARQRATQRTLEGVGACPMRDEGGHVWAAPQDDPLRSCVFGCGAHGREPARGAVPEYKGPQGGGNFAEATMARAEAVGGLRVPMVSGSGDPRKAWPNGMPPEMAERARQIREDKSRRDREAKAGGS